MSTADFVDEQTSASGSGLRALKQPGDPQWCWQTISRLQSLWQSLNLDYGHYMAAWNEAEDHKVWDRVPYEAPFGSKEEMLRQLEIGDDRQAQRRMSVQPIARRVRLRHEHGGDRRSKEFQVYHSKLETPKGGNKSEYLLGRILDKNPSVFERWERGEVRSVRAAALEAEIEFVQPKRTVTLGSNISRLADTLHGHYTDEEFTELSRRMLQIRRQRRLKDNKDVEHG